MQNKKIVSESFDFFYKLIAARECAEGTFFLSEGVRKMEHVEVEKENWFIKALSWMSMQTPCACQTDTRKPGIL